MRNFSITQGLLKNAGSRDRHWPMANFCAASKLLSGERRYSLRLYQVRKHEDVHVTQSGVKLNIMLSFFYAEQDLASLRSGLNALGNI